MPHAITVVHENPDFLVINKPSGLLTHPKNQRDQSFSVASWLLERYPQIKNVGEDYLRPGIVHRLDKETSGLLLVAKTPAAFCYFKKQFQERKIKKTYLTLVQGEVKNQSGIIEAPLGKIGTKQTTRLRGKKELKEKSAITEYRVLEKFNDYSLLEVSPLTGRTHQIRIHLKSIGHPVVCDQIYGRKRQVCPTALGRLFLHAQKLEFVSPSGEKLLLEADPPSELTNFLNSLKIAQ